MKKNSMIIIVNSFAIGLGGGIILFAFAEDNSMILKTIYFIIGISILLCGAVNNLRIIKKSKK